MKKIFASILIFLFLSLITSKDISTLSNYEQIKQTHLDAQLEIDFENSIIKGDLHYKYQALASGDYIQLDSDTLQINQIIDESNGEKLDF